MSNPRIGPFPQGVNNRRQDHELEVRVERSKTDLLRQAINVDVDAGGKLRRRKGYAPALSATAPHSLWGDDKRGFYVDGTELHQLAPMGDGLQDALVRDDLTPGCEASFCEAGGTYYYTNGEVLGMVRDGARLDFTPEPGLVPAVSAIAGALPKGRYQVAITQVGPAGESAATMPQVLDLPAGGGIQVSPIAPPASGCQVRIYMTPADGEVLARVDVPIESGVARIVAPAALGARCQTLLLQPMPAGSIVRFSNGRLFVAVGNLLIYSEPFMPGLFRPSKNFIPFSAPITVMEPCDKGLYVVADATYWFAGEITQAAPVEVLPYGAVPHSGGRDVVRANTCFWISDRGLVIANGAGEARNVQEDQLALAGGQAGATLLREQEGQTHIVTAVRDPMQSRAASGGYFQAEIIRKGVAI
ncbi:hypothetical protein [Acidovorax sp. BL-A-41-H1]|uniref:hypothetical protein n=1 Tax=Acidovorax sp. BL-A-41-H1 TaxID=3421102 RepID=UPI003F7AC17E